MNAVMRAVGADSLFLDGAEDKAASLCRAWIIQNCSGHPDRDAARLVIANAGNSKVLGYLNRSTSHLRISTFERNDLWRCFCPSASAASSAPEEMFTGIRRRRALAEIDPSPRPLADPATELLFTTNALISPPLDPSSPNVPPAFRRDAKRFTEARQNYWYDHPVPLDAAPAENEILYGLAHLDAALAAECTIGTLPRHARLDLALSISVTHEGMETLASDYVRDLISNHLNLKHLRVFLFDETRCRDMVRAICPGNSDAETVFGVNGAYGRHYSFLKTVLLIWQLAVNPKVRFTFKIDLDQVFDQKALRSHTGRSALQLLSTPLWGGRAVDHEGRDVDLGMLAGGLVNECDLQNGLFVPDVARPDANPANLPFGSRRVFCPQWPQALSTEAEIMQRGEGFQRIHVTGGTTGICDTALRKWQPFTPSFINRAEDQAYTLSAIGDDGYLTHLHAPGLIMRHDKQAFAARAIAHANAGKAIGDIERLMLFSRYAALHPAGFDSVQNHLWPFTSCFLHRDAVALAGLIFALDGANQGGRYVTQGAARLDACLDFCQTGMEQQLARERSGWEAIYDGLQVGRRPPNALLQAISAAAIDPLTSRSD